MIIQKAMDQYLSDFAIGHSALSRATYGHGLRRLAEYLDAQGIAVTDQARRLTVAHAIGFARWMGSGRDGGTPVAKSTLCTYLTTVQEFYTFLMREGITRPSMQEVERMRATFKQFRRGGNGHHLPKLPAPGAVEKIVKAARAVRPVNGLWRRKLERARNIAILEALRSSGMRVGELVGLHIGDLDPTTCGARVTGKGDKQRNVFFDAAAWKAIQDYLAMRDGKGAEVEAAAPVPVFARHDRRISGKGTLPLTTDAVRNAFTAAMQAAGIDTAGLSPHSFRHAFATRVLEQTGDLAATQDLMGHSSPMTTRIYAQVSTKRLQAVHGQVFDDKAKGGAQQT